MAKYKEDFERKLIEAEKLAEISAESALVFLEALRECYVLLGEKEIQAYDKALEKNVEIQKELGYNLSDKNTDTHFTL